MYLAHHTCTFTFKSHCDISKTSIVRIIKAFHNNCMFDYVTSVLVFEEPY